MSATEIEFQKVGNFTSAFVAVVKVTEVSGGGGGFSALVYQCKMNTDWDGAPTAYGLSNRRDANPAGLTWDSKQQKFKREREDHFQRNLMPLEDPALLGSLRDATMTLKGNRGLFFDHGFLWVGVVSANRGVASANNQWIDDRPALADNNGRFPVIQKDGPTKGYYVSQSGSFAVTDPKLQSAPGFRFQQSSYWDASAIPYCVWPSLLGRGLSLGDFGLAIANGTGRNGGFFFADTGSTTKVGECSGNLTTQVLGSPLNNGGMVSFIVFPKSGGGAAKQGQDAFIRATLTSLVKKLSGVQNAEELIRFLAMGADPDTFARADYDAIKSKGYFPASGTPAEAYENIRRALKEWGFQSARKPITV